MTDEACLEEIPVYGTITRSNVPRWDGGARSNAEFDSDCWFGFEVETSAAGVAAGFASQDLGQHYNDITHGIQIVGTQYQLIESGRTVVGPLPRDNTVRWYVMRIGGVVIYMKRPLTDPAERTYTDFRFPGKLLPGEIIYLSNAPSSGTVFIDTSFYETDDRLINEAAGERVWTPALEESRSNTFVTGAIFEGAMPYALQMVGGNVSEFAGTLQGDLLFTLEAQGDGADGAELELPFSLLAADIPLDTQLIGDLTFSLYAYGGDPNAQPGLSGIVGYLPFSVEMEGNPRNSGVEGELDFTLAMVDAALSDNAAIGYGELEYEIDMIGSTVDANRFQILLRFSDTVINENRREEDVLEELTIESSLLSTYVQQVLERASIATPTQTFYTIEEDVTENVLATIADNVALVVALSDQINALDSITFLQVVQIVEALQADGIVETLYQGMVVVTSAMEIADSVIRATPAAITDLMNMADDLQEIVKWMAQLADAMEIADTQQTTLTIAVMLSEDMEITSTQELFARYSANPREFMQVFAFLKTPAELAQGIVMNTEGALPISEYDNYTFNSLAYGPNQMLGANDQGLYILDGEDDIGTAINAELTSLMLDFETSNLKRMSTAYIGYTSDGRLLLKVRSVDQDQYVEHWYEGRNTTAQASPGENRMKIGKGLRSRYWTFELVNVDGSDFEVDKVELYPIVLDRRV